MPSRIVREGILTSERVEQLDASSEVFYRRLMSKVDDHGLFDARPTVLRASLYPLRVDRVREADISRSIAACEKAGLIALYAHDSRASSSRRIAACEMAGLAVSEKPYLQMLDTRWQARSGPKWPEPPWKDGAPPPLQEQAPVNGCAQVKTPVYLDVDVVVVGDVVGDGDGGRAESVAHAPLASEKPPPKANGQGTRLDPLWKLPEEWARWALAERPDWTTADVERVALVFRDHWHAKAGKDARKADWLATWRTWVRREQRMYGSSRPPPPGGERRLSPAGQATADAGRRWIEMEEARDATKRP